jgi:ABC-type transport system substrate-binding protein
VHRVLLAVTIVAAAGVCAPGCARQRDAAKQPVVLRIGIGIPLLLNPASGPRSVMSALRTDTWLTAKPDGRQGERIVTSWKWDDTGTVLHLKLRNDVYFQDGTKLTPELAADALRNSVANPGSEGALSFSSIISVTPGHDDSIELKLSEPNAFVIPDLALVSVRHPHKKDIGTGPFSIVSQDENGAVLSAFPKYYRGRPTIDQIEIATYPTQRKAWAALMRGDVDMLHEVSREAAEFVEAESTVRSYSFRRPYYLSLVFNVRHNQLKNVEVRKAINEALDRTVLIRDGLNGRGTPADGPIWPEHWAYSAPAGAFSFSPESARARLEAAGFTTRVQGNGRMPSRFSFNCLVLEDARFERLALLVQKELADVGIDVHLEPLKQPQMEERLRTGNFDAFIFEMFGRSLSWVYEFWHTHDRALFSNGYRAADDILDRVRTARSEEQVVRGMADLARVFHEDPPAAFIAWQATARAVSTRFDVKPEPERDILSNVWQWHFAEPGLQARR